MQIPLSTLAPFGTPRILDNLLEAVLINSIIRLIEALNNCSPDERRRRYAEMHPDVRALLAGLRKEYG